MKRVPVGSADFHVRAKLLQAIDSVLGTSRAAHGLALCALDQAGALQLVATVHADARVTLAEG